MKASEFNTSNYLNAETARELAGHTFTIYEVTAEQIRDQRKMVIGLEGVERGIVANRTNREAIVEAYGDDTDGWIGKSVRLDITKVMFEGRRTNSILLTPVDTPAGQNDIDGEPKKKPRR